MLYDPEDYDAALLVTDPVRPLKRVCGAPSQEFRGMVEREGWSGALQTAPQGEHLFQFFNGYQVRVQQEDTYSEEAVYKVALWRLGHSPSPLLTMNALQLTGFLRRIEALPAPDISLLGEF